MPSFTQKRAHSATDSVIHGSSSSSRAPAYDGSSLERFNTTGSVDLDALFDELAALDGAERLESQPQFMQNLGFAPDADLADVLSPDFVQFDPMMYMHRNAAPTQILDYNQPFNGG